MKFKFLEHTADIKFQAFGKTLEEAFGNSAFAMFHSMYDGKVKANRKKKIEAEGEDLENLLYNFLEELLILFDSERFFLAEVGRIKVDKKNFKIEAEVFGDKNENYKIHLDVKAVTYNEMFVKKIKDKWVTQVVLDV